MLFLFSEAMFFFSIFWVFFDSALSPSVELGGTWPPLGISPVNPFGIPLFNTIVLLSSGATLTWAHHLFLSKQSVNMAMVSTLFLAFLFEGAQYIEFKEASFSMSDGIFGSIFYYGTGFHGLHVILGHMFLAYNLIRMNLGHFSRSHHLSFEFSILYWHFVDIVWLFLFTFIYSWGW